MGLRKSPRAIQNARMRIEARKESETKRAVDRAIHEKGGDRTPSPAIAAALDDENMPASGVDQFETIVDAEADDLEAAINNPDGEPEQEEADNRGFTGILSELMPKEGSDAPDADMEYEP